MDQQKIGNFLKELRKEKNLTQEELAEKLYVSSKTISRWETGNNLPDISMLVEIAELYDVSIPEIIDGERKSEKMNNEVKETALSLSDYVEAINNKLKVRLCWLTIAALIGLATFIVIEVNGLDIPNTRYESLASAGLGLNTGVLIVIILYFSGILGKIKARHQMRKEARKKTV